MSELDSGSQAMPNVKRHAILQVLLWTLLIFCLANLDLHQIHKQSGVSVGPETIDAAERVELVQHLIVFSIIWLAGISGIVFSSRSFCSHFIKQKKTEEALRASEAKHRRLMENLSESIFQKDVNGVYVFSNKHYADDFGILPDELVGKTDFDFYPRELAEKYRADDRRLMESGTTEEIEEVFIKDGQEILVQTVKTPLRDDSGNITGILGIFRDINDRKLAEEALHASEERFSKAFRYSPDTFSITRLSDGLIIDINNAFEEMYGISRQEAIGKTVTELGIIPEEVNREDIVSNFYEGEASRDIEMQFKRRSGEVFNVSVSGEIIEMEGEKCILAISRDITDRKRAEQALRDAERRFRVTLENSPVCTKIVDLDLNLQYISRAGVEALKIDDITEYYGKPYPLDFYPESFKDLMTGNLKKAIDSGEIVTQEAAMVDLDGNELWFHSTIVPVNDDDGKLDYLVVVSVDTTEQRQAEEVVRRSEVLLNETQRLAKIGGWEWDVEKETMFWTDEVYRIHDLDPDEKVSVEGSIEKSLKCYDPKDRPVVIDAFNNCKDKGQGYDLEFPFTTFKGRKAWIRTVTEAVMEGGRVVKVVGSLMDITDRKEAEERRNIASDWLRLSVENMLEGYAMHEAIFDEDGKMVDFKYLEFNPAAEKILNVPREEAIGKSGLAVFPGLAERGPMDKFAEVVATGESAYIQDFYYDGDSLDKAFDISCFRLDKKRFASIFRDVSARAKYEKEIVEKGEQLRAANQQLVASEQQLKASNQQLLANEQERAELIKILKFWFSSNKVG